MKTNFRVKHLLNLLESLESQEGIPADLLLSRYLRAHKEIGSTDRKVITDSFYGILRWQELLDASGNSPPSPQKRIDLFMETPVLKLLENQNLAPHQKVSFQKSVYSYIVKALGEEAAIRYCLNTNEQAPLTIRVNLLKTTREALHNKWKSEYDISLCEEAKTGITFHQRINFHALPEFKQGLFEIQDEASQLISDLCEVKPRDEVLDYCAGGGGKSLAIGARMQNRGQLFLHDIRTKPLLSAKERLKRAGIQNAQTLIAGHPHLLALKKRIRWIIVDVPCSGSGTWRRNPDQKNRFTLENLENLKQEQRLIFKEALDFLHPEGKIIYSTCSVFPDENEKQAEYFIKEHGLFLSKPYFSSSPTPGKMDGFFGAVFSFLS